MNRIAGDPLSINKRHVRYSFVISITGRFQCSLRQMGEYRVRLFSDAEEALAEVRRRVHGAPAEVTVTDILKGESRKVSIPSASPSPTV